ncbi:MAG: hypothetical protein RIT27_1686 [Pseudomonadota bacterium]|jgi:hypothetical protein
MLRQIITPDKTNITLDLPEEYLGQEIEVLIFPISTNEITTVKSLDSQLDLTLFDKYQGKFDGNFNREDCYDRYIFS